MKLKKTLADFYLAKPIIIDLAIVATVLTFWHNSPLFMLPIPEKLSQINILSSLISTSVSLAGFMLAALTIIVTFKSNLHAKGVNEAENALELIFSSKHYSTIVKIFKTGIIELIISFAMLYTVWVTSDGFGVQIIHKFNAAGIFIILTTISRSLYILFEILSLENFKRPE
jgi:hypothetical protein